jgi:thioredoxin-dependent peroxiredoxin
MRLLAKFTAGCFVLGALALVAGSSISAGEKDKKVKVGDAAPSFESVDDTGKTFKSSSVVGKKIVVFYFYPADFTGGCTAQACAYRDDIEKLDGTGVAVIGISGDSVETHKLFKSHHKLPFTLLADEKGEVAKLFGIPVLKWGESPTIGAKGEKGTAPRGVTIKRWTVVIDKAGNIAALDEIKKAGDDPKRVAELVKKLDSK